MEENASPATDNAFRKFIPVITTLCCLICVYLYIGINVDGHADSSDTYSKWGAPWVYELFNGAWWGLITSNFLHIQLWHIGFNLYWFWVFGKKIEFESNKTSYTVLILSSALVSSLSELAFSDSTGIGLSGIVYALFGFLFVKSKTTETYRNYLTRTTVNLFIFWLALCFFLTRSGTLAVGNAAHVGGLLWGAAIAFSSRYKRYKQWLWGSAFISLLVAMIFFSPLSTSILSYRAYALHKNQKIEQAIALYKKILIRDPGSAFAKQNLKPLEVRQLEQKAYELHSKQQYSEARAVYNEILRIDPGNAWATENVNRLPKN